MIVTDTPALMVMTESDPDWVIDVRLAPAPTNVTLFPIVTLPSYVPASILILSPLLAASIAS